MTTDGVAGTICQPWSSTPLASVARARTEHDRHRVVVLVAIVLIGDRDCPDEGLVAEIGRDSDLHHADTVSVTIGPDAGPDRSKRRCFCRDGLEPRPIIRRSDKLDLHRTWIHLVRAIIAEEHPKFRIGIIPT